MPGRRDPFPFRPAPFPVYPEDHGPARLRWLRSVVCVICLLTALAPFLAGPSNELSIPVSYARLQLAERAPAVLDLDLPAADYRVAPASLGYFADDGSFVYSADVARGVIYATHDHGVVVLEIAVAPGAEQYLARQLDSIKLGVDDVNAHQNMLLLAREECPDTPALSRGCEALWDWLGPDLDGQLPPDWANVLGLAAEDTEQLRRELVALGRHRARLKQLYYDVQAARLNLRLAEFDLQLALARLPRPDFDGLMSLGDADLVRETAREQIARLRTAWTARQAALIRQRGTDLSRLDNLRLAGEPAVAPVPPEAAPLAITGPTIPESPFARFPESAMRVEPPVDDTRGADSDERRESPEWADDFESGLRRARIIVASAELESIRLRLAELEEAEHHVAGDGLPAWTDLPRHRPVLEPLQLNGLEELADFAMVEEAARLPDSALPLLIDLARCFETGGVPAAMAAPQGWSPFPDEVAYGLFIVDRCRLGPVESAAASQADGGALETLIAQLERVREFPADFELAQYNLGLLRFLCWYARLEPQPGPTAAEVAEDAVAESAPDAEGEESTGHRADVDDLFR